MDLYDKKILRLLIENCRYSFADIAKVVNLSKDSVKYRILRLEKEGIISEYSVLFNPRRLGYVVTHLLLKLKSMNIDEERMILEKIRQHKNVTFISSQSGVYDLQIIFHVKNIFQREKVIKELLLIFDKKVRDFKMVEHVHDYNFSFLFADVDVGISLKKKNDVSFSKALEKNKNIHMQIPDSIVELNKLDKNIMLELTKNPRVRLIEVANKVGMTSQGVKKRILSIIEKGCILQFSIYPNHGRLGLFNYMLMLKTENLPVECENELKKFLASNNFVLYSANMQDAYNLFVYILAKNPSEFSSYFKQLKMIIGDYVIEYDLSILTEVHKFVMISDDFLNS